MRVWIVSLESDSSTFYFQTEKKAKAFAAEMARNDDIPEEEIKNYFHIWDEKVM